MMENFILASILIPIAIGSLILLIPKKFKQLNAIFSFIAVSINLIIVIILFGKNINFNTPWLNFGNINIEFNFRLYNFSSFILLAVNSIAFLIVLFSLQFMKNKNNLKLFYFSLLLTLGFANGAVLANNLILMLFFWEALLVTLFTMIISGGAASIKTAVKAFVIVGVSDLCLIFGISLLAVLTNGKLGMDTIHGIKPDNILSITAFIFLSIGAISKAGSLPFHTWIPDAAVDAPIPFMALLPGALEKLLGIYFLTRICLDFFEIGIDSSMSILLMSTGSITIIIAVMMALIQKDYKKLLSYHAISQVGYMILGIGTGVPAGIVGGLFHMVNNAMYKSCLFLTAGSVENRTGTTDLKKLGGLARRMPVTFICFLITACSISGLPPFNGFFSKELVFDGAFEGGKIFYIAAVVGAFFTAASFLKLGHAVFLGPKGEEVNDDVKDPPVTMLLPMIVIALGCILFGVYNSLPLNSLIQPVIGNKIDGHNFAGFHPNWIILIISISVLILAFLNHLFGVIRTKKGVGAVDHIHHAPVLKKIYELAEKKYFDPYIIGMSVVNGISKLFWYIDRLVDFIYDKFIIRVAYTSSYIIRKAHTGSHSLYVLWSVLGLLLLLIIFVRW